MRRKAHEQIEKAERLYQKTTTYFRMAWNKSHAQDTKQISGENINK